MYEKLGYGIEGSRKNTKNRILEEAEDLLAQKGYHAVSVRKINRAAKCNVFLAEMNKGVYDV